MRRAVLFALVATSGCRSSPETTFDAWQHAIAKHDIDRAYALMSTDYRRAHDREAFAKSIAAMPALSGPTHVAYEAEFALPGGEKLPLVLENNQWRLARDPLDVYPQATPADALRSFIRAVENRRYEVVLRFVPNRYRTGITVDKLRARWEGDRAAELTAQLTEVRRHLNEPIEIAGDDAILPLGDRKQARLTREDEGWKVIQIE